MERLSEISYSKSLFKANERASGEDREASGHVNQFQSMMPKILRSAHFVHIYVRSLGMHWMQPVSVDSLKRLNFFGIVSGVRRHTAKYDGNEKDLYSIPF